MSLQSTGARRVAERLVQSTTRSSSSHICHSCRRAVLQPAISNLSQCRLSSSAAAVAAAAATPLPHPPQKLSIDIPQPSASSQFNYKIQAGIVLSRPPLITPDPHPFETAFYLYQRRLNERLALPFTQYFYYKKNTPAFDTWRAGRSARGGVAARDVGNYNAYGEAAWNDEVLIGDDTGRPEKIVEQLVAEEGRKDEFTGEGDPTYAGLRKRTKADEIGETRSLERELSRTLYLIVKGKGKDAPWRFPAGGIVGKEGLKQAAQRVLAESCGVNMNTFFVGHHPVGHYTEAFSATEDEKFAQNDVALAPVVEGAKTFYMKARIMAGQANLNAVETPSLEDFKWVTKDEIKAIVPHEYWIRVRDMLAEQ